MTEGTHGKSRSLRMCLEHVGNAPTAFNSQLFKRC